VYTAHALFTKGDPLPIQCPPAANLAGLDFRTRLRHQSPPPAATARPDRWNTRGALARQTWAGSAGAIRADVGVADLLAARSIGPGLPQSTPSR